MVKVDHPDDREGEGAIGVPALDADAIGQMMVGGPVRLDQGWVRDQGQPAKGLVDRLAGKARVDADEGFLEPAGEERLLVALALGPGVARGLPGAIAGPLRTS